MKKSLSLIFLVLLIPSILLNVFLARENKSLKSDNLVTDVIDGDTFILKSGQRIRLSNIYAPEPDLCGGKEAKERLESLILNKIVTIKIVSHDRYNRPLALVYEGNNLVNEIILKEGWARYDGTPNEKRETLKAAYDVAFSQKKGIFSSLCISEKPENPKCLIKGNISRSDGSKVYHFPGCSEYDAVIVEKDLGEKWFCSEKEAEKEGFVKAQNCFGKSFK